MDSRAAALGQNGEADLKNPLHILVTALTAICSLFIGVSAGEADDLLLRGEYLTKIMDCGACHTPRKMGPVGTEPDGSRYYMAGHPQDIQLPPPPALPKGPWKAISAANTAWAGPWGISYSSNLTPDRETGIGTWSEKMFAASIRSGKHAGTGRNLLPPMPKYPELTDEDMKAIYSYLRNRAPVANRVPPPTPPSTE
jgi:mono/diheme cytochrome c family protein